MDWSFKRNRTVRIIVGSVAIIVIIIVLALSIWAYVSISDSGDALQKAERLLATAPLIDGYNGFAYNVRQIARNDLRHFNFSRNLSEVASWNLTVTDIPKLRAGKVGAQIWAAHAECLSQHKDAVIITLEQIDVIKRLIAQYSQDLMLVTEADDIMKAVEDGKIASLIAIDGGHAIQYSLSVLRSYYELGVRIMGITSYCSTPWAESFMMDITNKSKQNSFYGLSDFGKDVILEMNRLGMIIDISQSSTPTMKEVLFESAAPVIFSRSAAKGICNTVANVPDEVFKLIRQKEALVMIHFFPGYIKCDNSAKTTIQDVIRHLEYIREKATIDNIALGSNFEGFSGKIEGLEDVSKFPNLFAELLNTGRWSEEDLQKIAGKNFLRVFHAVQDCREGTDISVPNSDNLYLKRDDLKDQAPTQTWIKKADLRKYHANFTCLTIDYL